jgi:hypothetical protein
MSRMNDISIDIQDMLTEGVHPTKIAKILSVPLSWVYDALEMMESSEPSFDPYETINS